jgi:hypothetical protein
MSLSEYEETMSTFHILHKFKHLFNSLEYSVNIDGKDLVNAEFDKHACHLFKPGILHSTEVMNGGNYTTESNTVKEIEPT